MLRAIIRCLPALAVALAATAQTPPNPDLGFKDTPILPGQKWHVMTRRPYPPVLKPGAMLGAPPSDAIVLFEGKDLSKWGHAGRDADAAKLVDTKWPVKDGYFEVQTGSGPLVSREKFGDIQLHVEWSLRIRLSARARDAGIAGSSSWACTRSRSSICTTTSRTPTAAGAIYGQWPPLATVPRPPGEWRRLRHRIRSPEFDGEKLVKPAYQTVFWNGVVLHNHKEVMGPMVYRNVAHYRPHEPEGPIALAGPQEPGPLPQHLGAPAGSYN